MRKQDKARAVAALEQMTGAEAAPTLSYRSPPLRADPVPIQHIQVVKPPSGFSFGFGCTFGVIAAIIVIFFGFLFLPAIIALISAAARPSTPLASPAPPSSAVPPPATVAPDESVNVADEYGMTALHRAARDGNLDGVKRLLANGAKIDACSNKQWTALHLAAWHGKLDAANALIDAGADINAIGDNSRTPLMLAKQFGTPEMVALLQRRGAK